MKSWFRVILVLALVALVWVMLIGCGGGSGPEATVRGAFKATEAMNAERLASYFTEDVREEVVAGAELVFAFIDEVDISNLKTQLVSQSDDSATVAAEYDYELTLFGQTNSEHQSTEIELTKVDGKWLYDQPLDYGIGE